MVFTLDSLKKAIKMVLDSSDGKMDQHTVETITREFEKGRDNISIFEVKRFQRVSGKAGC